METWFNVNGATVCVTADGHALLDPLLLYFGELSAPRSPPADFQLALERRGERFPPLNVEILCTGPMPEGQASQISHLGEVFWFNVPGALSYEYSLQGRWGRLSIEPSAADVLNGTPAIVVANTILSATGQFLFHAAALRIGKSDRAVAIFAPSGVGKTTTTLALTLAGFGFLTDDATVFMPPHTSDATDFRIWGLPRSLKVHRRTRELLPRIAPLLGPNWNRDGEQVLHRETLATITEVCPPRPFALAAIVVLGPRVEDAHIFHRANKAEVLLCLAEDNVRRAAKGMLVEELNRFQMLSAAVAAVPAFELRVGNDLALLGRLMMSQLGDVRCDGPSGRN